MRVLNEQELTVQEKEDICQVQARNGVIIKMDDANVERVVAQVATVGEGQH